MVANDKHCFFCILFPCLKTKRNPDPFVSVDDKPSAARPIGGIATSTELEDPEKHRACPLSVRKCTGFLVIQIFGLLLLFLTFKHFVTKGDNAVVTRQAKEVVQIKMDFADADFRGFVFCIHADHGYMLLHSTHKKKKPHHFQLPGGHIDAVEFKAAEKTTSQPLKQLLLAGQMGAARELLEETGMDLRNALHRLQPTQLYKKNRDDQLSNEYKRRLLYTLHLTDEDFLASEKMSISEAAFLQKAMGAQPPALKLKLSHEHQGFTFEKNPATVATLLQYHSGGKLSAALSMATALSPSL